jgi:hypothetical protein
LQRKEREKPKKGWLNMIENDIRAIDVCRGYRKLRQMEVQDKGGQLQIVGEKAKEKNMIP